jgi:hypothetical protein
MLDLTSLKELEAAPESPGHSPGISDTTELAVRLPFGAWKLVLRQLGDGSINRFLPLLTRIDQQLSRQLANGADE